MKKQICALLLAGLLLLPAACGAPAEQAPQGPAAGFPQPVQPSSIQIEGKTYRPLAEALKGTAISYTVADGRLLLTENGLEVELRPGEPYLYRRDRITAVLPGGFVPSPGKGYLSAAFLEEFLEDGTLLDDLLFFKDEVTEALERPESGKSQAVLSQVELPRSMDISIPNLNISRIFDDRPLSGYPVFLTEELRGMGFDAPEDFTYSEYTVLTEARSVEAAGLSQAFLRNQDLSGEDPARWTVSAYHQWEKERQRQQREDQLTVGQRDFLLQKKIHLEDVPYLERAFYFDYMSRTDQELQAVLRDYYQFSVDFLYTE